LARSISPPWSNPSGSLITHLPQRTTHFRGEGYSPFSSRSEKTEVPHFSGERPAAAPAGRPASARSFGRQQVAVGPQPAEPPRPPEFAVGAQAHGLALQDGAPTPPPRAARPGPGEQVQRQVGTPLMHRHQAVAGSCPADQRAEGVADQPASSLRVPEVEPAVVDVQ